EDGSPGARRAWRLETTPRPRLRGRRLLVRLRVLGPCSYPACPRAPGSADRLGRRPATALTPARARFGGSRCSRPGVVLSHALRARRAGLRQSRARPSGHRWPLSLQPESDLSERTGDVAGMVLVLREPGR